MPTYLCLCNWTQKGIENVKDSPKRLDDAKALFRELGVELKSFYMTAGRYDIVLIVEAKDENALARATLAQGAKGGIRCPRFPDRGARTALTRPARSRASSRSSSGGSPGS